MIILSQPVTVNEIADFLQLAISAFSDPLFMVFVIMVVIAVCMGIKKIMLEGM